MVRSAVGLGILLLAALAARAGGPPAASCRSCDVVLDLNGKPKSRVLYATAATTGRVDAFCVGANGRLGPQRPSITGLDSPRRLVVDQVNHRLYVAETNAVDAYRIGPNGGLKRLWRFPSASDFDTKAFENTRLEIQDLALASDCTSLYVPAQRPGRLLALTGLEVPDPADPQHVLSPTISSCAQGPVRPAYRNLMAGGNVLYSTGSGFSGRVDAFRLGPSGELAGVWNTDDGGDCRPGTKKCAGPKDTCSVCGGTGQKSCPVECGAPVCPIPRPDLTTPDSTRRRLSKPLAFQIVDSPPGAPGDRFLYVAEQGNKQILGFQLRADGLFEDDTRDGSVPQKPFTRLHASVVYLDLVARRSDDPAQVAPALVGSQFNDGRLDAFVLASKGDPTVQSGDCHLEDATPAPSVCLPRKFKSTTGKDLRLSPVRMQICRDDSNHDWVYAAMGLRDRIQAIRLSPKGAFETGTREETPESKNSFPNDVAVAVLDGTCP